MTRRNPVTDRVAIVGVGTAPYSREGNERTPGSLAIDACTRAIRDAGLTAGDIDGICGSAVAAPYIQTALGIPATTWWANLEGPCGAHVIAAMNAVYAGTCNTALVYHSVFRTGGFSRSAARDPYRVRASLGQADLRAFMGTGHVAPEPFSLFGSAGYAAWAGRYLHDYGAKREYLGHLALNARRNARDNENAVLRAPLTMEDFLTARMIREPLCLYDMDIPVDGADAFVLTTRERAEDSALPHVLIHAATMGQTDHSAEDQTIDLAHTGQSVVMKNLWAASEIGRSRDRPLLPV